MSRPGEAAPLEVVAAVIRRGDGRVLLAQRLPGGPHGGLWEFPGGKVEAGESPEAALRREIREELGVEVEVGGTLLAVDHDYPHVRIRLSAYSCTLVDGVPRPLHCQDFAWALPEEFGSYPMPAADLPVAAAVRGDGTPLTPCEQFHSLSRPVPPGRGETPRR